MAVVDVELTEALRLVPTEDIVRGRPAAALESIRIGEDFTGFYGLLLLETLRVRERLVGNEIGNVSLRDAVVLADAIWNARDIAIVEAVGIAQTEQIQLAFLIIEQLRLSEALQPNALYQLTLRQSFRLVSSLARFFGAEVVEALGFDDDALGRALAIAQLTETVGIETTLVPQLLMSVTVADGIDIDVFDRVHMLFNPTIEEGVSIDAGYIAPDGSLVTWTMNTRTGAVTEYADYAFNSFAAVDGRYLGAAESGLYELDGDDDAGAEITGRIRSGFMQFGGTKLSRLSAAYLASRNDGEWVLKIEDGDGKQYNYGVSSRNMRSTKVHMGKGMRSRYFAFELISTGHDFDLDTLEFVPIVVTRRV